RLPGPLPQEHLERGFAQPLEGRFRTRALRAGVALATPSRALTIRGRGATAGSVTGLASGFPASAVVPARPPRGWCRRVGGVVQRPYLEHRRQNLMLHTAHPVIVSPLVFDR